jgi:hypothetical protein
MKTKQLVLKFYSDPGHGWVAVKTALLISLGIADKVSSYSYINGQTSYLEEDCDAGLLLEAIKGRGIPYSIVSKHTNRQSPIRSYDRYKNI